MSQLVANCPRCNASNTTFDLRDAVQVGMKFKWQRWYEGFCTCRHCRQSTVFYLSQKQIEHGDYLRDTPLDQLEGSANQYLEVEGHVSLKDEATELPPEHLPPGIDAAFREGATCLATGCFNAAGTMFRLCIDLATRGLLPPEAEQGAGLTDHIRRTLGLRLKWLFEQKGLPENLFDLSTCIKEDGNDGAHEGTLRKEDAEDILDFTRALLERLFTEPERLKLAKERRVNRRVGPKTTG